MKNSGLTIIFAGLAAIIGLSAFAQEGNMVNQIIESIPNGYHLRYYDNCGVYDQQPHMQKDALLWTFTENDTEGNLKSRSAAFGVQELTVSYLDLDPKQSYILALTYANDHVYNRVQSLWANGIQLHGPYAIPKGKTIRVIVKVPQTIVKTGKLKLQIKKLAEANATVSIIELWSTGREMESLHLNSVVGTPEGLTGQVLDAAYNTMKDARISLYETGKAKPLSTSTVDDNGWFLLNKASWQGMPLKKKLRLVASTNRGEVSMTIASSELSFSPVRYRPVPVKVEGLESNQISIDGIWRINPSEGKQSRNQPLDSKGWGSFKVPGQWLQQGYDIPQQKPVAMAREFVVPKNWAGYRMFLRFDAIHAGTNYWLNGKLLGYSENLFTPVEWEITNLVRPGKVNRLDLEMVVSTASERLSYASGYAFHNLGGIDRSVCVYALPKVNVKDIHIDIDLDAKYRDAAMQLQLTLDNLSGEERKNYNLHITLLDSNGKAVAHSNPDISTGPLEHGQKLFNITTLVPNPQKWTAETPNLYKLIIDVNDGSRLTERIEQNIGFRKIEVRDRQVYINGQRVKLTGACHHELDPLTGRADTALHAAQDIELMKQGNLNYVRTSHYPPTRELLDECDRIGMYVECEAPLCWIAPTDNLSDLKEVLVPTSAMIDYNHTHPSVIIWSLANESNWSPMFNISNKLCKDLDPTRLTTFNWPVEPGVSDIANSHYPLMPYDEVMQNDPRPLFLGEYKFPVCHEQTDVMIDPGLRELPGQGHADPNSAWGRECAKNSATALMQEPIPGYWSYIYHSDRVVGGAIWAALDEPYYFSNGTHCGYAWVHGFWGIIDAWRRPKPELWLSKLIFSPVWFLTRDVDFTEGQTSIHVPVENRYSFTNLNNLSFSCRIGNNDQRIIANIEPGKTGEIEIPVPAGTREGEKAVVRVTDARGELINIAQITLGKEAPVILPELKSPPEWTDDGKTVVISGDGWSMVFNRITGRLISSDPRHNTAITEFPALHLTQFDGGDLGGTKYVYGVLPDAGTRVVDEVTVKGLQDCLELSVKDHYDGFTGSVRWMIDKNGMGRVSYDYTYSGSEIYTRELGIKYMLRAGCEDLYWSRWSEWGDTFPEDSIMRTNGKADARRNNSTGSDPEGVKPEWSWSKDQTSLGTNDFRGTKFNIYNASLRDSGGDGIRVHAMADAHIRASLTDNGVMLHILSRCPLGPVKMSSGDRITSEFTVELIKKKD